MKICHLFHMEPKAAFTEAREVLNLEKDYGDEQYGHRLYDWTGGGRTLYRCRECGAYVLKQLTEIDSFDDNEEEYTTYWPVADENDAEIINRTFDGDLSGKLNRVHLQEHYQPHNSQYALFKGEDNVVNFCSVITWHTLQDLHYDGWELLAYPILHDDQIALMFRRNKREYRIRLFDIHTARKTGEYAYTLNDGDGGTIWLQGKSLYAVVRHADNSSTVRCVCPEAGIEPVPEFSIGRNVSCIAVNQDGMIAVGYHSDRESHQPPKYELAIFNRQGELQRSFPAPKIYVYTDVTISPKGNFQYHVSRQECIHTVFEDCLIETPTPEGSFSAFSFSEDLQSILYVVKTTMDDCYDIFDYNKESRPFDPGAIYCNPVSTLKQYFAGAGREGILIFSCGHRKETANPLGYHHCPVCGKYLFEKENSYDVCPSCGWEDDWGQKTNPDDEYGANRMSLNQARELYNKGKLGDHLKRNDSYDDVID